MANSYEININETIILSIDSTVTYNTTFTAEKQSGTSFSPVQDYNEVCTIVENVNTISITGKELGRLTINVRSTGQTASVADSTVITIVETKKPMIKIEKIDSIKADVEKLDNNTEKLKEVLEYFVSKC